jgi:hypothetical protein
MMHLTVTSDGTSINCYDNGISLGPITKAGNLSFQWIGLEDTLSMSGRFSDPMFYRRCLSPAEIQQLADPSNVMLSGLILPPRRKLWAVSGGAPPAFKAFWARGKNTLIGGGVA